MPYHIQKHSDNSYSVINVENGRVHSAHTTLLKAKAQVRLLYGIEHGMRFKIKSNNKSRDETPKS